MLKELLLTVAMLPEGHTEFKTYVPYYIAPADAEKVCKSNDMYLSYYSTYRYEKVTQYTKITCEKD